MASSAVHAGAATAAAATGARQLRNSSTAAATGATPNKQRRDAETASSNSSSEEDGPHGSGATASSKGNIPKSQRRSGSAMGSGKETRVGLRSSARVQKLAPKDGEERGAHAIAKQSQSNASKSFPSKPSPAPASKARFIVQQTSSALPLPQSPPAPVPATRSPRLLISHKAARPAAGHRKAKLSRLLSQTPVHVPDLVDHHHHHHRHHHRRRRPRTSSARRAEQNRSAQRAFRERRLQYVKSLEEQLSVVSADLADAERIKQENSELQRLIRNLQRENALLRKVAVGAGGDVPDAVSLSPTDSDDADSSNADAEVDGSSPEQVPQDADFGAIEPIFSAAIVGDLDGVYDLSRLKHEAGEGSRAYDAVLAHIGPDGRLRRSLKMELALSADADADAEIDALDPLAYVGRSADTDPSATEPFYDLSALKPAGIARDLAGETAFGPSVTDKRLVSDGFGAAIFPLITPPLSDTSTPAYSGYGLSLDTPEHDGGLFDDAGEVPSVRRFPSSSSAGDASVDVATPPQDGPHRPPATDAASGTATTSKRPLRDAEIYTTAELQCSKTALTRNETFDRDPVEEELCERMRAKALLGEVDPSAFNKSKFIKKTTSS